MRPGPPLTMRRNRRILSITFEEIKGIMSKNEIQPIIDRFLLESPLPWWEWDIPSNTVTASPLKVEMLGYRYRDFDNRGYEAYTGLLHPEDYERTMDAMRALLNGRTPIYQVDYRIRAVDGEYRWYMDRGAIIACAADGSPGRLRGIVLNLGANISAADPADNLLRLLRRALPGPGAADKVLTLCSSCLRIRSGERWLTVSPGLREFIAFPKSHGMCEDCLKTLYPDLADDIIEELDRRAG